MKLKSLIAFAGVVCAAASYGETTSVETGNTLCRIKFTTSEKEVLIGLPLVDVGGTTQTINATNYVMAANLADGDALLGKVNGSWGSWVVSSGAWTSEAIVENNVTKYSAAADASFTRGGAVRLSFKNNTGEHTVYLYGQVATSSDDATVTATRSKTVATYTLLSNINSAEKLITQLQIGNVAKGDKIALLSSTGTGMKEYYYDGSKWMEDAYATETVTIMGEQVTSVKKTTSPASKTFQPGEGFFYITAPGNGGNATFTW